jgi:hypothetical protein
MISAKGANQTIDIKFGGVGADVADCEEGVAGFDVGEGGGHSYLSHICDIYHFNNRYAFLYMRNASLKRHNSNRPKFPLGYFGRHFIC